MPDDDHQGSLELLAREYIPGVDLAAKQLRLYRLRRMHAWWSRFSERQIVDSNDVEDEIFAAIGSGNEKTIQAIMEGSRAAANSIDPIVLPAIALIGRSYVRGDVPPWFQRNSLIYLSSLSAEEVGHLRTLLHAITTAVGTTSGELLQIWPGDENTELIVDKTVRELAVVLPNAVHALGELKRHGLGQSAPGFQSGPSPKGIFMELRAVRWLADALPPVRDP